MKKFQNEMKINKFQDKLKNELYKLKEKKMSLVSKAKLTKELGYDELHLSIRKCLKAIIFQERKLNELFIKIETNLEISSVVDLLSDYVENVYLLSTEMNRVFKSKEFRRTTKKLSKNLNKIDKKKNKESSVEFFDLFDENKINSYIKDSDVDELIDNDQSSVVDVEKEIVLQLNRLEGSE